MLFPLARDKRGYKVSLERLSIIAVEDLDSCLSFLLTCYAVLEAEGFQLKSFSLSTTMFLTEKNHGQI